ncbi:MAG TPA: 1-acyl-sn-glycerol-3-phosphate acyltransferase [Phnomibacter sp.]|nr:1-acyl-sn-glycerol-3-phosphate acyltransferase [Phnomibacter sp.]
MRWFWKWYLKRNHWKIIGSFPFDVKKMVLIVAPHTHWLDFIIGVAVRSVMQFGHVKFLAKAELFKSPFGFIFRWLGGTPVDRTASNNLVDAVVKKFNEAESLVIAISPEGTRKKVDKLKTGFYHIARQAQVPIMMVALDFGNRRVIFAEPFSVSDNEDADFKKILHFFAPIKGRVPEQGLRQFMGY